MSMINLKVLSKSMNWSCDLLLFKLLDESLVDINFKHNEGLFLSRIIFSICFNLPYQFLVHVLSRTLKFSSFYLFN